MEAKNSKTITNEMIFEELKIIRSQMEKLQSDFESFKNPVGEFTSKWVDTYDVMQIKGAHLNQLAGSLKYKHRL
jgi:hypothetical protein